LFELGIDGAGLGVGFDVLGFEADVSNSSLDAQ